MGCINRSLNNLYDNGYVTNDKLHLTNKAISEIKDKSPKCAIILAAGVGMRMIPINTETPKALIMVNGETLIERQIKQLHEVGITEIYVVVGFMKEMFEYLIDDYGVELIVNNDYASKNNLNSLNLAREHIENAYIIPCDIWSAVNPFSKSELYSWYMVTNQVDDESNLRVNRKMELQKVSGNIAGNTMIGIAYLVGNEAAVVQKRLLEYSQNPKMSGCFWEETLYENDKLITYAKVFSCSNIMEINTYEQLRELDSASNTLNSKAISIICETLNVQPNEIMDITVIKKGMTNHSFIFTCNNKRYIMRIPGEGTEQLINRFQESETYHAIQNMGIADNLIYINPENGYKITEFIENARNSNAYLTDDVEKCMKLLRKFHSLSLKVNHVFDIFQQIEYYESLWNNTPSIFRDYRKTKEDVFSLQTYINQHAKPYALTHIDAVPDNFLIVDIDDKEMIKLIDWEYAAMQDQDVDLAMYCIYAMYNRAQVDKLIDTYYSEGCIPEVRIKIYCYIAACGLLWSNWCEYKRNLGVEFNEYALRQYRFAKDYYNIVQDELKRRND